MLKAVHMNSSPVPHDALGHDEQATVPAAWDERAKELRQGLDLETEFRTEGATWVEADAAGSVRYRP